MSVLRPRPRWLPWLALVASLAAAAFCASGYAMSASFASSNPEQLAHWRTMGLIYGIGLIGSIVIAVAAVIHLMLAPRRRDGLVG